MKKDFDAVELMRTIREKLHKEYVRNPELRRKRLNAIRKKYKIATVSKETA